jgi:hypothetical protein
MIHYQTWPTQAILVSDWPIFFKSSLLKPRGQMNVSVHLAKQFQRRRFFYKSTNQKQELHVVAMFANRS